MNYQETLEYMYNQLPMFHRIGKAAYKANLNNALALDEICGHPHRSYKTIHIAGTNGKGSVSHMLASILQQNGYKTGLFTSPHLLDFRERIKISGEMIPENAVTEFISANKKSFEEIKPSFFEMTSALAFQFFRDEKVNIAVIETGMGGRLDSTNIITPELSVITNIGFDHTEFLGDTLPKIAAEKAGIIKTGIPVVIGEQNSETEPVFVHTAKERSSELFFASEMFEAMSTYSSNINYQEILIRNKLTSAEEAYKTDLRGHYQQKNICTVLAAVEVLKNKLQLENNKIQDGIKDASRITGLNGRWQVLSQSPTIICDTGHNEDGMKWVVRQIAEMKFDKLHFIFGVVNDKDISKILPLLPESANYYFTKANIPRALDETELMNKAADFGLHGKTYSTVKKALDEAKKNALSNDLIFIGGSTFIVADALQSEKKY